MKARILPKERLGKSSEPAGFEDSVQWLVQATTVKRVWLLAGELPPPAGCVRLLHAFDCFLFNWMEGAPLCKGAMITEISAKLLNYA